MSWAFCKEKHNFVFYSYDTDKEVWRVKCPVIKESEVEEK